jgi:hypothetical protein
MDSIKIAPVGLQSADRNPGKTSQTFTLGPIYCQEKLQTLLNQKKKISAAKFNLDSDVLVD